MTKYYSGIATGTTLDTMLANGHEFGVFPSQDIDCQDISARNINCLLYTSPSPRDRYGSRMPSSA